MDWSGLGRALAARMQQIGGDKTLLTPTGRKQAEAAGVAVPYMAFDASKNQYYSYYNGRQVAEIEAGKLTKTTDIQAEVGKRGESSTTVEVQGQVGIVTDPVIQQPLVLSGVPIAGVPSGVAPNQPHPFAGTNVEELVGVGVALAVIMGGFKIVGAFLPQRGR